MSEEKKDKKPLIERFKNSKFAEFMRDKVKPVAGDIVEIVGDVTGIDAIERVGQLINKGKEQREELKALDAEFQKYRLEWELEMERIRVQYEMEALRLEVEDRESARGREIDFMKVTGKRDWLMGTVVISGLVMTAGVLASLVFIKVPEENKELAYMAYGSILTIGTSIFSYYVGSSRGSARKDDAINRTLK